jgi:hypothetical protein
MQSIFLTPNNYVFRAIMHSIDHIQSTLTQATTVSCAAAEPPPHHYTIETYLGIFSNLQRLMAEAKIHLQHIELTLEEEVHELTDAIIVNQPVSEAM